MATITLKLPRPHQAQRTILSSPSRYKILNCGRRFGKTELFIQIALQGNSPQTQGMLNGLPIAYVSLTDKNVKEFWERLKFTVPNQLVRSKNEVDKKLTLITGGSIECWTFENFVTARGRAYAGIILDEAAITPNLQAAWDEVFQAMLLDYEGWAVLGSTPNGLNQFFTMHGYGENPELTEWASWTFTSYDNPYINPDEIDKLRLTLPIDTFNREYMAEFSAGGGGVFTLTNDNIWSLPQGAYPLLNHRYAMGIDWGQANDFTVASVSDVTDYKQVARYRRNQADFDVMIAEIVDLAFWWGVEKIYPEGNAMGAAINMLSNEVDSRKWPLNKQGYPSLPVIQRFNMDNKRKDNLVKMMIMALLEGYKVLEDPIANHEMRAYKTEPTASGLWRYTAPSGGHDDTVIADMLAHFAAYELR